MCEQQCTVWPCLSTGQTDTIRIRQTGSLHFCTHVSVRKSVEAVVHRQHVVSLNEAHPDGRAHRRVHTGARRTDVHNGHVDVALGSEEDVRGQTQQEVAGLGAGLTFDLDISLTFTSGGLMWARSLYVFQLFSKLLYK